MVERSHDHCSHAAAMRSPAEASAAARARSFEYAVSSSDSPSLLSALPSPPLTMGALCSKDGAAKVSAHTAGNTAQHARPLRWSVDSAWLLCAFVPACFAGW